MKFDSQGWLDQAIEIDYLNKSMSRQGYKITHLVIHGTAGGSSAQGIANYFATSDVDASAHIEVDQNGVIAQGIPLSLAAWANGVIGTGHASYIREDINPNYYTVSIEFVKSSTDNSDALTAIQQQVGFELIKCICDTYNIPKRVGDAKGGIIKHADIDPVNRSRCPGNFDFPALWAYLQGGNKPMTQVPQGWTDNGTTLKSPDGTPVLHGFRDHILNSNWDPTDVPLEAEQHLAVLEQSNPSLGSGQRQLCRKTSLEYTPKMGVFEGWIGQELLWCQKQNTQLTAQVADLQEELASAQAQIVSLQALPNVANLLKINGLAAEIVKASQVQ